MVPNGDGDLPVPEPMPGAEGSQEGPTKWAHSCGRCGDWACFGFNTRRGIIWACSEHRADAEMLLEAPTVQRRLE